MLRISSPAGARLSDLVSLILLTTPVAALVLLLRNPTLDPQVQVPGFHFAIVTLTALCGIWLAALILRAADRLGDPRTFFLGLSFLAVAGFFFIHGLLTPGVVVHYVSTGIGWAPPLGLLLGATFLALSSERPRPGRQSRWFRRRRQILLGLLLAWAGFLALAVTRPGLLANHPTSLSAYTAARAQKVPVPGYVAMPTTTRFMPHSGAPARASTAFPWISMSILGISAGLYLLTAWRYAGNYRLTRTPQQATVVAGVIMLTESQLSFFFASTWRISWWEYHILVLLGFGTILYGLLTGYRQQGGVTATLTSLMLDGSVQALERSYSEVLTALVAAVETRDPYTKGHSQKVARIATQIGEAMGLPPEALRVLYQAGLLHDVGKIGIPDAILSKPGRLSPEEYRLVRTHPFLSEDIVGRITSLRPTLGAIRWHHERLDGSGYPEGLRGERIPLEARILAVADVYDAMTSGRSYREAWSEAAVLAYLRQEAGRLFDPRCVAALHRVLHRRKEMGPAAAPAEAAVAGHS
ncbi:MAG: HD-GYP domain-containing protein [Armatimonadota bacterium]|nr:HD-GYP domain-containing protein [Armatimonadota bacterium]MDR7464981.1 HD-GYP domain-containing protein [Armatimonadota bacterium]MDR7474196.1 HD-GYP domain-containing protein [Armatimonadota bacterium]MDR7539300.1 HD-GYP domain-containing protein [Armatimonadota bacterium]